MDERRWVSADPFRAHLNHVCAEADVPWPVVAASAGLPLRLVRDLLDVRPGRRVRRIAPELASHVLRITAAEVGALRVRHVGGHAAHLAARRLLASGWTPGALAATLRISRTDADALVRGELAQISALTHFRLAAVAAAFDRPPGRAAA